MSKLAVGLATPIAVAVLAFTLNQAAVDAANKRADATQATAVRDRKIEAELAVAREERVRTETLKRDREAAAESARAAALVRQETFAREAAVRRDTAAREDAIRLRADETARQNRIIDRRIGIWDELGPRLNDIYSYVARVGAWQSMTAAKIVLTKRETDKLYWTYRPFMSPTFSLAYKSFIVAAFSEWNGHGQDARIIADARYYTAETEAWRFEAPQGQDIRAAYEGLLLAASSDLHTRDLQSFLPAAEP